MQGHHESKQAQYHGSIHVIGLVIFYEACAVHMAGDNKKPEPFTFCLECAVSSNHLL